ncbi:MAG: putative membrane protein [Gammaproteobacteria bacterium]|jgi:uncharacterized membrane protein
MIEFIIGVVLFFGIHSVSIFALSYRNRIAEKKEYVWKGIYSLVSIVGLVLLVRGYGDIRISATVYYVPPIWMRHIASLLILPVFVLLMAPYFPSRINKVIKHPQLVAIKLWAMAHLLVNGSSADLLLFGAFLIWAVVNRISVKRRPIREVPHIPESNINFVIVVVVGIGLYMVFAVLLHGPLIGVKPFG